MAHPDLQALVDSLLPFAQSLLGKYGSFHPFGAHMTDGGDIQWVGIDAGEEFPEGQLLIDTMADLFKKEAASHQIRAAVICYDGLTLPPGKETKTDVIVLSLEHRLGEAIDVFVPYVKDGNGDVQYGAMFAINRQPQFFATTQ